MRLIAIRDFRNVGNAIEIEAPIHPDHIHQGATFTVGKPETPYDKLNKAERDFVGLLNLAYCVGDATDPVTVEKVKKEVALRERQRLAERSASAATAVPVLGNKQFLVG